jgi:hypothetical protein
MLNNYLYDFLSHLFHKDSTSIFITINTFLSKFFQIILQTSVLSRKYWQESTGKYKGTVNQHIFFIATKLINFCKLNTKINSII